MERSKIDALIKDKNERLERQALRSAEELIDAIAKEQGCITAAQKRIDELRSELKALNIQQMNAAELLGE